MKHLYCDTFSSRVVQTYFLTLVLTRRCRFRRLTLLSRRPVSPQVHTYKRLTPFSVLDHAVETLDNLRPGDCIVCFSKNDIYSLNRQIEARGQECAVIYGSLPPGECVNEVHISWSISICLEENINLICSHVSVLNV